MTDDKVYLQAINKLQRLMAEARARGVPEANSAALATADTAGRPSVRMVFITVVDAAGLLLFANLDSGKGHQLVENPHASVCFFWQQLQEQAIVEGRVVLQSEEESDRHWRRRPREVQLAAWASRQNLPAKRKGSVLGRHQRFRQHFSFDSVPRSPQWRAFRIEPKRIEFWATGWHRMRDRSRYYELSDGCWVHESVEP